MHQKKLFVWRRGRELLFSVSFSHRCPDEEHKTGSFEDSQAVSSKDSGAPGISSSSPFKTKKLVLVLLGSRLHLGLELTHNKEHQDWQLTPCCISWVPFYFQMILSRALSFCPFIRLFSWQPNLLLHSSSGQPLLVTKTSSSNVSVKEAYQTGNVNPC